MQGLNSLCSVPQSCLTLVTPWTAAYQAPLSMGLLWKEYWRRLPLPPSGDLPNPGTEPTSPVAPALAGRLSLSHLASPRIKFMSPALPGRFLTTAPPGKVLWWRRVGGIFKTSILSLSEKCKAKPQWGTKTSMRYHRTLVRMVAVKKPTNNKCCRGCGEREPSYTVGGNAN